MSRDLLNGDGQEEAFRKVYRAWLQDPVTLEVFRRLERLARPVHTPPGSTGEDHAYRNGVFTGYWRAVDDARALDVDGVVNTGESPTPTYTNREE